MRTIKLKARTIKENKPRSGLREPTIKQRALINDILANVGVAKENPTKRELLLRNGYSNSVANKTPSRILNSPVIKSRTESFIKQLEDKREMAISHLTKTKLERANARDTAYTVDILTKNHQLLTGGDTERGGVNINLVKYTLNNKEDIDKPDAPLPPPLP